MADSFKELTVLTKTSHDRGTQNHIALFILVTLGISVFNLILLLIQAIGMNNLAHRPMPTMVQTINGKSIEVTAFEGKNRSPQLIKDFTVSTFTKLFVWQQYLPLSANDDPHHPQIDPGVPVESKSGRLLVPTTVWGGSFALSDKFREEFLGNAMAPLMSSLQVLQGRSEVAFIPLDIQDPIEVKGNGDERLWKVKLVANLAIRSTPDAAARIVPFNKDIYVRAVLPPSLTDAKSTATPDGKDLAQIIAMNRASGLEIYGIEDYELQDTKPSLPNSLSIAPVNAPNSGLNSQPLVAPHTPQKSK
jgi:hypothetical protein